MFKTSFDIVTKHNSEEGHTFTMGLNHLSDNTPAEIQRMNGFKANQKSTSKPQPKNLPTFPAMDWREKGAVTPVKDQGKCGSCWAFSTIGQFEGAHFVATGKLEDFSEQELVDCDIEPGVNEGCEGGFMENALHFLSHHSSIYQDDYKYTGSDDSCSYDKAPHTEVYVEHDTATRNGDSVFHTLFGTKEDLQAAVSHAPVSIAVQADLPPFRMYSGGVIDTEECGKALNHGITAVGFGTTDEGQFYFIVKNSWG
jgi:C1A family cysteine protease